MSMDTFKLAFLFIILAIEACHGVSSSKESIPKAGEVDYAKCVTDNDCVPVPPYLDCMGASARCYKGTCYCYYGIKESGVSSSKESIPKAGEVDYAKCVTDNDCVPVPPYLDCMGASARCYKGTCYCYYGIKESGVSPSKESTTKTGEVDYAKCVTDNDCIPYPPYLDCMGASARCYKGTCYCYWG